MKLDPQTLAPREFYGQIVRCITPRPIAWVSTISPEGCTNLAPFSFFNGVGANPPSVVFCPVNNREGRKKDTLINVEKTKQFCINIVSHALAENMNRTSAEYEYGVSEFAQVGLSEVACDRIAPPRVGEAAISMECVLHEIVSIGNGPLAGHAVTGTIVLMHIREDVLDETKQVDPAKIDTIGRLGGSDYCTTRDRFTLPRPPVPARD